MTYRNSLLSASFSLGLLFAVTPALAVMVKPSFTTTDQSLPTKGNAEIPVAAIVQSGVISAIDVAQRTIVVGKTPYMFIAGLTRVRSSDPLINGNPLKLKTGQVIQFITIIEAGGKLRISDILVK